MLQEKPRIVGERVVLREFKPEDGPAFLKSANDIVFARYLAFPYPIQEKCFREFLAGCKYQKETESGVVFGIEPINAGEVAGLVGLVEIIPPNGSPGQAEIIFGIGRDYRKMGLTSEAVDLALKFGFYSLGLGRIIARVAESNTRSQKLLERAGFTENRKLTQTHQNQVIFVQGFPEHYHVYSLNRTQEIMQR